MNVHVEIVIIRKNKAVLNAEICPWSKVDGHSLLSNRVEFNLNGNVLGFLQKETA